MILIVTLVLLIALNTGIGEHSATLRVDVRVKILKEQLERSLRSRHNEKTILEPIEERVEQADDGDGDFVTPILEKKVKLKHKKAKSSTGPTVDTPTTNTSKAWLVEVSSNALGQPVAQAFKRKVRKWKNKALAQKQPEAKALNIFYRKAFFNNVDLDATVPFVHCAAMVSPYFTGTKKQVAMMKVVTKSDHIVLRLIQLLNVNTTDFVRDEVVSVIYQISKLKIRIWGWDLTAMNMLFNVITRIREKDRVTSFETLKAGLKRMFDGWKLDRSNVTRLLLQARVYRPPCLMHRQSGSSRFVPGSTVPSIERDKEKGESDDCKTDKPANDECNKRKSIKV